MLGFHIAKEYERGVVLRLGRYIGTKGPGLYWIIPLVDRRTTVDLRVDTTALEGQETVTKDSVTIKVNAVLWSRIFDAAKSVIEVFDPVTAVFEAALTSLRTIIGQHDLDQVLKERDAINSALRLIVDEITEQWGIKVVRVEIKDVEIPPSMQRAMAREAEAIREKRARIIKAQGEQEASTKLAEASEQIMQHPMALELRRLQMVSEVGAEHNSTVVMLMPSDFVMMARHFADEASGKPPRPRSPARGRTRRTTK
jgi:regulator of protease activity HflC (stomatin/prohibitin superfamily)